MRHTRFSAAGSFLAGISCLVASCDDAVVHWAFVSKNGEGTAVVHVVATDSPALEVDAFLVTITYVAFHGPGREPETVYLAAPGHRVDLLSLRGTEETRLHEIIASRTKVAAGAYDRIEVRFEDPLLVLPTGETVSGEALEVAGGGSVEVTLEQPIDLTAGETALVVLDFDVERSLTRSSGAAPRRGHDAGWRVDPLVLVEVVKPGEAGRSRRLSDVSGRVLEVDSASDRVDVELTDGRGIVTVSRAPQALQPGDEVRVSGRFHGADLDAMTLGD